MPSSDTHRSGGLDPGTRMGRFELVERLAVGGMAELYLARQPGIAGFEKLVVLKRVLPHLAEDPEFLHMFVAEARMAATLEHPNIVHVSDIGEQSGEVFFAMEYVHGRNLRQVLARGGSHPLSLPCALTVVAGVAAGLHYAHEQVGRDGRPLGLVHRDVSPSNVMISYGGAVKLADFGIAKAAARTSTTLEGRLKGKVGYMSPEQARGEALDRRSDVFALGILLYEATTGARAFHASNDFAVLGRIAKAEFVPPAEVDPGYPDDLAAIVDRALRRDPEERFPTAEALQIAVEELAQIRRWRLSALDLAQHMKRAFGSPAHPQSSLPPLATPSDNEADTEPAPDAAPAPAPVRRRWAWLGASAVVVAVGSAAAWHASRASAPGDGADAPAISQPASAPSPHPDAAAVGARPTDAAAASPAGADAVPSSADASAGAVPSSADGASVAAAPSTAAPEATPSPESAVAAPQAEAAEPRPHRRRRRGKSRRAPARPEPVVPDRDALYPPGLEP